MQPFKTKNQSNLWNTQRHMAPWTFQEFEIEISEVFFKDWDLKIFPSIFSIKYLRSLSQIFHWRIWDWDLIFFSFRDLRLRSHYCFKDVRLRSQLSIKGLRWRSHVFFQDLRLRSQCVVFFPTKYISEIGFEKWRRNLIWNYAWKLPMSNHNSFSQRTFKKRPDTIWNTSS